LSLGVGYLVVIISILANFEISASSSVLVCGAIVAEALYSRWRYSYLLYQAPCSELLKFKVRSQTERNGGSHPLQVFARGHSRKTNEIFAPVGGLKPTTKMEELINGASDVNHILLICIICSAIIGTLIWGYAHLVAF
jgi:hypothetical protein